MAPCSGQAPDPMPHSASGMWLSGLVWICLTCIIQKGILFSHSLCPPSYELTPSFSTQSSRCHANPSPAGIQAEMGWPDLGAAGGCKHILVIGLEQSSRPFLRKPGAWPSSC